MGEISSKEKYFEFLDLICDVLAIPLPEFAFQMDDKLSFMDAYLTFSVSDGIADGFCFHVKEGFFDEIVPERFLAIAHECRHIWQWVYYKDLYMKDYKIRTEFDSVDAYNLQLAEIDANAFASLSMQLIFKVAPLWKGFSKKVVSEIGRHMGKICPDVNDMFVEVLFDDTEDL